MSTTHRADTPAPALSAQQFPCILEGLTLAALEDRSVLSILGLHAIEGPRGSDGDARTALRLDESLSAAIEASGMIYPLRHARLGDDYYVEYLPERGVLFLKYQRILGSRLLIVLTQDQAHEFEDAVRRLRQPRHPDGLGAAEATLAGELSLLTVRGNRLELPTRQLEHYRHIKALIQRAGGRYARNGFSFEARRDVEAVLAALRAGEEPNPRQERQAFFTPAAIAGETVDLAARALGGLTGKRVLEPSAGEGSLADAARGAGANVLVVELHGPSAQILRDKGYQVREQDFLTLHPDETGPFDAIIANPPFRRDQDVAHVTHMWRFLRPGGVLVSLMSPSWQTGRTRAQREFLDLARTTGAHVEELPSGAFKASGTTASVLRVQMLHRGQPETAVATVARTA